MDRLGPFMTIWENVGPLPYPFVSAIAIWSNLKPFRAKWLQMAPNGSNGLQWAPMGSTWLQMARNGSKLLQMDMAETNGYGNGPKFSQMVINGPKRSITIHYDQTWSKMVKYGPRLS